jgi:hypothetical protein
VKLKGRYTIVMTVNTKIYWLSVELLDASRTAVALKS